MKTGLTKQEKTTDICFDEKEPTIHIRTHNTDLKNRLTKYSFQHPTVCKLTDDDLETGKDGASSFRAAPWTAWVVEENKVVRLVGYTRYFSSLSRHPLKQRKKFLDDYGAAQYIYPWDPAALDGTTAENCKLDRYIEQGGVRLAAYLALWRRKPTVENLVTHGYGRLVDELIDREQHAGAYERKKGIPKLPSINWKEKKPNRMLDPPLSRLTREINKIECCIARRFQLWERRASLNREFGFVLLNTFVF